MSKDAVRRRMGSLLLLLGPITTLAVSPGSNYDPINLIKLLFVTAFAFSVLGLILSQIGQFKDRLTKEVWIAAGLFVTWMCVVFALSGAPFNQQFWGVFGRNTGFLTYFSLMLVLVGCALVQERSFYRKLVEVLVLTSIPTTIYALFQLAGKDPVAWSVKAPFATLGNVNFSSAFFGLASLCAVVFSLSSQFNAWMRISLLTLAIVNLLLILQTGSIQGFMIFVAGSGVAGYFWLRSFTKLALLRIPYLCAGLMCFILTCLALKNIGPFARFVFGDTILFRFDYWFAGWDMTRRNPIFGVGLDSYGDWYRELRGEIATLRTVPDRITNTAHNIYLDLSASGGFPLLLAYLAILGLAARAAWRITRRATHFDPYFVALFSTWIAYLIQAAISINQVGVGIWGWLFTGSLIGYEVATREENESLPSGRTNARTRNSQMPAKSALAAIASFAIGFVLAFIPFSADMKFKDALQTNSLEAMSESVSELGSTAFHYELTLDAALKQNNDVAAKSLVEGLLARYPRDFMAWQVKSLLPSVPADQQLEAQRRLLELDPFNNTLTRP